MNKHILKGNRILATAKNMVPFVVISKPFSEIPTHFDGDSTTIAAARAEYIKALSDKLTDLEKRIVHNRLDELKRNLVNISIANRYRIEAHQRDAKSTSWHCAQHGVPFYIEEYLDAPLWMKRHWQNCKKRGTSDDKLLEKMKEWWSYGQKNAPREKWCEWNNLWQTGKKHAEITRQIVKWSHDFFHGFRHIPPLGSVISIRPLYS